MISIILMKKIISLFIMILMGVILVRTGLVASSDSRILSVITIYLLMPFSILIAYQKTFDPQVLHNMLLSLFAAVLAHVVFFLLTGLLGRPFHLTPEEKGSVVYPNAGNLIFPLVVSLFGNEWLIYASIFVSVQQIMVWTQGKMMLCGERKPDIRKIFTNVNMICIFAGILSFLLQIKIPTILTEPMSGMADMLGPCSMLVAGMIIGGMDFGQFAAYRKLPLICVLRLLIYPIPCLLIFRYSSLASMTPDGETVLLISLLAISGPAAASITQLCQIFGKDADYASAIYVCSTLLCMITMPLMVFLYQLA